MRAELMETVEHYATYTFLGLRPGTAGYCLTFQVSAPESQGSMSLHAGEIELRGDDVGGIAVHLAARICGAAVAGEVLVSSTVADLVAGSDLAFASRGRRALKGIPREWELLAAGARS